MQRFLTAPEFRRIGTSAAGKIIPHIIGKTQRNTDRTAIFRIKQKTLHHRACRKITEIIRNPVKRLSEKTYQGLCRWGFLYNIVLNEGKQLFVFLIYLTAQQRKHAEKFKIVEREHYEQTNLGEFSVTHGKLPPPYKIIPQPNDLLNLRFRQ